MKGRQKISLFSRMHTWDDASMINLCWLRYDLRLHDHAALSMALKAGPTHLVYIFEPEENHRFNFIHASLVELEKRVNKYGASIHLLTGKPEVELPALAKKLKVSAVHCNRDQTPFAKERDTKVARELDKHQIQFIQHKDNMIFEANEILTGKGEVYKVFTAYKKKWLEQLELIPEYKCQLAKLAPFENPKSILKKDWFKKTGMHPRPLPVPPGEVAALKRLRKFPERLDDYSRLRDFPAQEGTSGLSPYLKFGNVSVRDMVRLALTHSSEGASKWLSEIIWRDFFHMLLDTYPELVKGPYRKEFAQIKWEGRPAHFKAWCEGRTGFPIIDAAMRCLNATGLMHNRLRMITATFLCKTLLIDWRKGEAYFAEKLLDFDQASNNGGWQWCAGCGVDAQPWFRIFNPYLQTKKFDPQEDFIHHWCPEYTEAPPTPIVSYELNRVRCLKMYSTLAAKEGRKSLI